MPGLGFSPRGHATGSSTAGDDRRLIRELRPKTCARLLNSIDAMYQFRGEISLEDKEQLLEELVSVHGISIDRGGRVSY